MISEKEKICSKCCQFLPLELFSKNKDGKMGRSSICKTCTKAHYYTPNKAAIFERCRQRRMTTKVKERERIWHRNYRRTHRIRRLVLEAKSRALARGIEFNLNPTDFTLPSVCPVLGIPISIENTWRADSSPSLERIDNTKGYIKGNVIVISWRGIDSKVMLASMN